MNAILKTSSCINVSLDNFKTGTKETRNVIPADNARNLVDRKEINEIML